jgi:hypothetical protein
MIVGKGPNKTAFGWHLLAETAVRPRNGSGQNAENLARHPFEEEKESND